jgi:hypothetical protein
MDVKNAAGGEAWLGGRAGAAVHLCHGAGRRRRGRGARSVAAAAAAAAAAAPAAAAAAATKAAAGAGAGAGAVPVVELAARRALGRGAAGAGHLDGLGAPVVGGLNDELDLLALGERAEAVGLDRGLVDEDVLAARVGGDEAEAVEGEGERQREEEQASEAASSRREARRERQ